MTPSPRSPAAPDDLGFFARHWKSFGGLTAVFLTILAWLGYLGASPGARITKQRVDFDEFVITQHQRDSLQDARIAEFRDVLSRKLDALIENQNNQLIAECLRTTTSFVRVKLECRDRLKGEQ